MSLTRSTAQSGLPATAAADGPGAQSIASGYANGAAARSPAPDPSTLSGTDLRVMSMVGAIAGATGLPAAEVGENDAALALALLRALRDPVFLMDPDGRVTYMNPAAANHLARGARGRTRSWCDLWPEASEAVLRDLMAQAREGESNDVSLPGLGDDGEVTLWRISFVPLEDSRGEVAKILCILREG
ncbi:PAS domain-containing protein [Paracoccus cavernae]|uniref:PAS domain-containing protein n=1 Tax=Paracoccus cavernae TaxID=1571207 RepID=UPI0035F3440B